jgi:hypothetical protein
MILAIMPTPCFSRSAHRHISFDFYVDLSIGCWANRSRHDRLLPRSDDLRG